MNIIKYVISKRYRKEFQNQYSVELVKKFDAEHNELEKIYKSILEVKHIKAS